MKEFHSNYLVRKIRDFSQKHSSSDTKYHPPNFDAESNYLRI